MRKIATCCYCGTRAALILRGEGRHELACAACGAPLREMKAMPGARSATPEREARTIYPSYEARRHKPARPSRASPGADAQYRRPRRKKKRGRVMRKVFEEIWDVVEDIFD